MSKLNDLKTDLPEEVDLSDSINKNLRVSKKSKKNILDLKKGLKPLNLKKKRKLILDKLKNKLLDPFFYGKLKIIDVNTQKKFFSQKIEKLKYIFKKNLVKKENRIGFPKTYKIIFFGIFGILFILTLDGILLEQNTKIGYEKLLSIKNNLSDTQKVKKDIEGAENNFLFSKIFYTPFSIIPNGKLETLEHLINGGVYLTKFLNESFFLYENLNILVKNNKLEDINFIEILESMNSNSEKIDKFSKLALSEYNKILDLGDKELNDKLTNLKNKLKISIDFTDKINKNFDTMLKILAKDGERKYLIIFQNNDEIRPTGGFMGSFATIYLYDGKIQQIETKDVYAYEWSLDKVYKDKEEAPEGLKQVTSTFSLRDANFFPEIKDSSESIKYFLDKMDYNIDGIIYINQDLIKGLLDTIDYIDSDSLGTKITSQNFSIIASTLVEAEVSKLGSIGTPKQVLFDFSKEFYTKLLGEKKYYDYLNVLFQNIKSRDIVFYSFNPEENSLLWKLGINGEINFGETLDFNYPVITSIGGNKTDRYMNYKYEKNISKIAGTCNYKINLSIYNKNNFSEIDENYINTILSKYNELGKNKEDILYIQGKAENKSYLRILLPKSTKITAKNGQKISENEKYKTIEFYTSTPSSGKSVYNIEYILENPKCEDYDYKFIKQPGISDYDITFIDDGKTNIYENIKTDFIYKKN